MDISDAAPTMPPEQNQATQAAQSNPPPSTKPRTSSSQQKVQTHSAGSNLAQKSLTIEPTIASNAMPAVATTPPPSSSGG